MVVVDRDEFIAWVNGVLLSRDAAGRTVAVHDALCNAAEDALEKGEAVLLTTGGRVVSTIQKNDGSYVERGNPL